MTEAQLVSTLLSPVIFISAAGLLVLSINVRLMGIVSRLRSFHWECHQKERAGAHAEAQALELQIQTITRRAVLVRNSFFWVLASVFLTLVTCLLLGLAVVMTSAYAVAILCFALGIEITCQGNAALDAKGNVASCTIAQNAVYTYVLPGKSTGVSCRGGSGIRFDAKSNVSC